MGISCLQESLLCDRRPVWKKYKQDGEQNREDQIEKVVARVECRKTDYNSQDNEECGLGRSGIRKAQGEEPQIDALRKLWNYVETASCRQDQREPRGNHSQTILI